ncbi:MAG: hypothetical protein ACYC3I_02930, partial [Gemmataceae bacterium]
RWALALARRRVSGRGLPLPPSLPITPVLEASPFLAVRASPITPARLPAAPAPRRLATGVAAIAGLGTRRREASLTTLEQTTTASTRTPSVWPLATEMLK